MIAVLLIGAGINACMPWKSVKWAFTEQIMASEDDEEESDDERSEKDGQDSDEERSENEEREVKGFENDFLGSIHAWELVGESGLIWHDIDLQAKMNPIVELEVPPPKHNC